MQAETPRLPQIGQALPRDMMPLEGNTSRQSAVATHQCFSIKATLAPRLRHEGP